MRNSPTVSIATHTPIRGIALRPTTASDRVLRSPAMPGIRFAEVRARVTMAEVLGPVGFVPRETSGDQVRGPCPARHSASPSGAASPQISDHMSTDVSNAGPPGITGTGTPRRPAGASSRPPSSCASGSTVKSPGCSRRHRASPGHPVASLSTRGAAQARRAGRLELRPPMKAAIKRIAS